MNNYKNIYIMPLTTRTILVPTDFSETANNAAFYAGHLAREIKARILLLHAYHIPVPSPEGTVVVPDIQAIHEANEHSLKELTSQISEICKVEVRYKAVLGLAMDEILEEEKEAMFTVMGMQGASKIRELLIGSLTTSFMKKACKPVVVVPYGATYKYPENIVYACDFDPDTDVKAIEALQCFLKPFASRVHIVNVREKGETRPDKQAIKSKVRNRLKNVEYSSVTIEDGDVPKGLDLYAHQHHADMLAVVPHKRGVLENLFHKSQSRKLAFHTHLPLLVLPETKVKSATYLLS
jgi:nucleotide-binding universal stress UspA family protein